MQETDLNPKTYLESCPELVVEEGVEDGVDAGVGGAEPLSDRNCDRNECLL